MKKQFVIFLNGVSSCGKSSIAKELLKSIKEPTIYLSLDNIHENLCDAYNNDEWELYKKECYGLHKSAKVWEDEGFNVIVDTVLETQHLYKDAKKNLPDAVFVGVYAPLETLLEREEQRQRDDFKLVKYQFKRVHKDMEYNLRLNSDIKTPKELADEILVYLKDTYE